MNYQKIFKELEAATIRSAFFDQTQKKWVANQEVKKAILASFKEGKNSIIESSPPFFFSDKDTLAPQKFSLDQSLDKNIRIVPGGTTIRPGVFLGRNVIVMPPSFINVGAFIDDDTMVDSHVLVGSCAQIGKRVHLSAAVQIGGVLEPIGLAPVVIEDDAFIGAGCIIVEGVVISSLAVLAPGVILSKGSKIYDRVHQRFLEEPVIPPSAVVVMGQRRLDDHFTLATPIIVKYRDAKTDASLVLEDCLR